MLLRWGKEGKFLSSVNYNSAKDPLLITALASDSDNPNDNNQSYWWIVLNNGNFSDAHTIELYMVKIWGKLN